MLEPTQIKTDPDSVSENTEPQTQEAPSVKGEQTQQNPKGLESTKGVNALEPEPLETDSFLKALIEHNQNKAPAQDTNQAEVDVEALQQLIAEGADPTQLLEETAAGEGEPTDGGGIYIPTIERTGDEVLADAGFDTTTTASVDVVVEEILITAPVVIEPPTIIEDNDVEISGVDNLVVDEDGLPGAVLDASRTGETDSTKSATAIGNFVIDAPDGVGSVTIGVTQIISNGVLVSAAPSFTTGLGNTFTVTAYNAATGEVAYQYTLKDNESHNLTDDPNTIPIETAFEDDSVSETFAVVLTDTDGDTANTSIIVKIVDDIPNASVDLSSITNTSGVIIPISLSVDETDGQDTNPADNVADRVSKDSFAQLFSTVTVNNVQTADYGTDGAGSIAYALSLVNTTTPATIASLGSGLYALDANLTNGKGSEITLSVVNGDVVGKVGNTTYFTIAVDSAGEVTFTQDGNVNIWHPDTTSDNDAASLALSKLNNNDDVAIRLTQTVTDADGDTATASVDLESSAADTSVANFTVLDDGPSVNTVTNTTIVNVAGETETGTFDVTVGTDVDSVASLVGNVVPVGLTSEGDNVLYFVDPANPSVLIAYTGMVVSGVPAPADQVFKLTLLPGSDQYIYNLYQPIDGPITTVSIDGASAFGSGPQPWQELTSSGTGSVALLSGWNVVTTGPDAFNLANWQSGTTVPVSQLTFEDVNGSTTGWGVNNNNFNLDEFMRFDFADADDFDGAGGYVPPTFTGPNVSVVTLDFIGYSNGDEVQYVVHYVDGTSSHAVLNLLGTTFTVDIPSSTSTKSIDYVEVYDVSGSGKVDLVSVGTVDVALPDALNFAVSIIDADGDTDTDTLTITFDNPIATSAVLLMSVALDSTSVEANTSGVTLTEGGNVFANDGAIIDVTNYQNQGGIHAHGGTKWSIKGIDEKENDAINNGENLIIVLPNNAGSSFTVNIVQGTDINKTIHNHTYTAGADGFMGTIDDVADGTVDPRDQTDVTLTIYSADGTVIGTVHQDLVFNTRGDHSSKAVNTPYEMDQDGNDDSFYNVTVEIDAQYIDVVGNEPAYITVSNNDADIPDRKYVDSSGNFNNKLETGYSNDDHYKSGVRVSGTSITTYETLYTYTLMVAAALIDTDGSEVLSDVLITASTIPTGYVVTGAVAVTIDTVDYYQVTVLSGNSANITLTGTSGSDALTDVQINTIAGSVTSTETGGGFVTTTTTATARVESPSLVGTAADEVIFATIGDETLTGTTGTTGTTGSDIFTFESTATGGTVTITDFDSANDQLDLRDLLDGEEYTVDEQGNSTGNLDDFLTVSSTVSDTTIVADIDGSGAGTIEQTIVLQGVDLMTVGLTSAQVVDSLLSSQTLIVD